MISRRVVVNVFAFLVLAAVLVVWAGANFLFPQLAAETPTRVTAQFSSTPGLFPQFLVTYLGHPVGNVGAIELQPGHVAVELVIRGELDFPADVEATVRRQSAIGEPYVSLRPAEDSDPEVGPRLQDGDVIPLDKTRDPMAYGDVFRAADALLAAIDRDELATLVSEVGRGLDGHAGTIRQLITDTEVLTASVAANGRLIDEFVAEVGSFTAFAVDQVEPFVATFDDLHALIETLQASTGEIARLVSDGPDFFAELTDLLEGSWSDLDCTLASLAVVAPRLGDDIAETLVSVFPHVPQLIEIFDHVTVMHDDGLWVRLQSRLKEPPGGEPLVLYERPRQLPAVPALRDCAGAAAPGHVDEDVDPTAGQPEALDPGAQPQPGPQAGDRPPAAADPGPEGTTDMPVTVFRPNVWWLLAGLLAAAAIVAVRPWRWLAAALRSGGSDG